MQPVGAHWAPPWKEGAGEPKEPLINQNDETGEITSMMKVPRRGRAESGEEDAGCTWLRVGEVGWMQNDAAATAIQC